MSGSLLVAGTTSDAGKSIVTTGLCRAFARRGLKVAPYKAQNMSNNSMVCAAVGDGRRRDRPGPVDPGAGRRRRARGRDEPGAAQAGRRPQQPRRRHGSAGRRDLLARSSSAGVRTWPRAAHAAYDDLASRFDIVVSEGAGSPAEINLRAGDYVNMGLARHADIPTVVVGDIDRGGVFAAMFGTVALLEPADQRLDRRVRGQQVPRRRDAARARARPARGADRAAGSSACCRGAPTSGSTPRTPSTSTGRRSADRDARAAGRGDPAAAHQQLHRRRRARASSRASTSCSPASRATEPAPTSSCCPAPAPRSPTSPGCARAASTGRSCAHAAAGRPVLGHLRRLPDARPTDQRPRRRRGRGRRRRSTGSGCSTSRTTFGAEKVLRLPTGAALGADASGYEIHHGRITAAAGRGVPRRRPLGGRLRDDVARQPGVRRVPARRSWPRWRGCSGRRTSLGTSASPTQREPGSTCWATWSRSTSTSTRCSTIATDGAPAGCPCCRRERRMTVLVLGGTSEARELAVLLGGRRTVRVVAGRPGRPPAAAGRRGADRRVRRRDGPAVVPERAADRGGRRRDPPVRRGHERQRRRGVPRRRRAAAAAGAAGLVGGARRGPTGTGSTTTTRRPGWPRRSATGRS